VRDELVADDHEHRLGADLESGEERADRGRAVDLDLTTRVPQGDLHLAQGTGAR
jgi:hypothetical protein